MREQGRSAAARAIYDLSSAFDNAVIGMTLVGPDNKRLKANKAFCEFLGYTEAELLDLTLHDIVYCDDVQEDLDRRAELLAGKVSSYSRQKRYLHRNGHLVWGELNCTLVRDAAGRPLHFIVQVQDITQRRKAEHQLRDAQAMLDLAAQVGRLGAWAFDVGEQTLTWSEEACSIHDVTPGFRPTIEYAIGMVQPEHRELARDTFLNCLGEGTPFDIEVEIQTCKHRRVWIRIIGEPHWNEHGNVQRLHGALQDITEAKLAEQEILQLNAELENRVKQRTAQLEDANRQLKAFSYSIAHDLRAPLASIHGFATVLERQCSDVLDDRSKHYLQRIKSGIRHIDELADGLLALAALSRAELRAEPVDLTKLAVDAVRRCRERDPQREIDIRIEPDLHVHGDRHMLIHVIDNLVGNAWKFTSRRESACIEIGSADSGEGKVFFVRDNGAGFDMQHAARMFEPFQRMHTVAEFEGTGIGLAIVSSVIGRHGGKVWAIAAGGAGATFYFRLP